MFSTISALGKERSSAGKHRVAISFQTRTLVALSLLGELSQVDGIFVTHFVGMVVVCRDWGFVESASASVTRAKVSESRSQRRNGSQKGAVRAFKVNGGVMVQWNRRAKYDIEGTEVAVLLALR